MSSARSPLQNRIALSAGCLVLAAMPIILLRAALGDLSADGEKFVWVNPAWAVAGLGFAGLSLVLVGWLAWTVARGSSPAAIPDMRTRIVFGGMIVAIVGGLAWRAEAVTDAYAAQRGYARCLGHDRFQAGNVRKNDVTLHAYARLDGAVADCNPR